eukprot:GHVQ01025669.1.p1 GENE.GHVQ01025669.1~~GHVQ01025669.1.p1  ORF type:complete len:118 (+),score=4.70 GHVQ01025669.1:503-856(+)
MLRCTLSGYAATFVTLPLRRSTSHIGQVTQRNGAFVLVEYHFHKAFLLVSHGESREPMTSYFQAMLSVFSDVCLPVTSCSIPGVHIWSGPSSSNFEPHERKGGGMVGVSGKAAVHKI